MKKLLIGATVLALLLGLAAAGVQADMFFPNNTEVQSWYNSQLYTGPVNPSTTVPGHGAYWYDVIGDPAIFETTGATLSGSELTIHTNWPGPDKVDTFGNYTPGAVTADLFIRYNTTTGSNWDFAIALGSSNPSGNQTGDNGRLSTYFTNPQYNTSTYYFGTSGLIYGGKYNIGAVGSEVGADVPVFATGTGTLVAGLVTWGADPVIDLSLLPGFDMSQGWNFLWATGTCANDTAQGAVPLPGAILLLGAGLARLAAYARRRMSNS